MQTQCQMLNTRTRRLACRVSEHLASLWQLTDCHAAGGQTTGGHGEEPSVVNRLKIYLLSKP